jgi:hypothetical protein
MALKLGHVPRADTGDTFRILNMAAPGICTVCNDPRHSEISDALLASGGTVRGVAARFKMSSASVGRHRVNCLRKRLQSAQEPRVPERVKALLAGTAQINIKDRLNEHALLECIADTLDLLRENSKDAAEAGLYGALASLSAQTFRGVQAAAQLQGLGNTAPAQSGNERFSISINLSQPGTTSGSRVIDGSAARVPEAPPALPPATKRDFGVSFDLGSLDASLDAA